MNELEISAGQARELTDRIKVGVEAIWELIKQAYQSRAWAVLGYDSWDDYCTREFGTSRIKLPREERQEVVASMREIGMSTRAIASATGNSIGTIHAESRRCSNLNTSNPAPVTGTDGKTYPASQPPRPELEPETTPEPEETPEPTAASASMAPGFEPGDLEELNNPRPSETHQPRAEAITSQFTSAISDLTRVANRFRRIADDKNFPRNKEKVAAMHRHDLDRLIGELQTIADEIN